MSLKLFYSQLNLHSSALHECLKRCSPAMQACLETYDDTLYCTIPGAGLQWVWRKISFLGAWASRQRKWGKALKYVAFSPRRRAKRQRKWGKWLKFVASLPRSRAKRQRKWGKWLKFAASPPTSSPPTTPLPHVPINPQNHSGRNEKNMLS